MIKNITDDEIYAHLRTVLPRITLTLPSLEHLTPDTRLVEDLDMGSVRLVDLVLEIEDKYGINIDDDRIGKIRTLGDITTIIRAS